MNKIISGKTILLNTVLNTTFVANDLDEQLQTSTRYCDKHIESASKNQYKSTSNIQFTRYSDKHIEWVGELDIAVCEHQFQPISNILWKILDDIDTASDIIKPTTEVGYKKFYEYVMKQAAERFKYLTSDGYGPLERMMTPEPDLTIK